MLVKLVKNHISKLKIIKKLGTGDCGTIFLCKKRKINIKLLRSIILQILNILIILYDGGYSHDDLHIGIKLIYLPLKKYHSKDSAIDYEQVTHAKYGIKGVQVNRKKLLISEFFGLMMFIVYNSDKINKKKMPWEYKINGFENGFYSVVKDEDYFNEMKNKYLKFFPKIRLGLEKIEKNIGNIDLSCTQLESFIPKKFRHDYRQFTDHVFYDSIISEPELYLKKYKIHAYFAPLLNSNNIYELLQIDDINKYFDFFYNLA